MAQKKDNAPTSYSPGRIALAAGLAALAIRLVYLYVARHNGLFVGLFLDSRYYAEVAARLRGGFGAGDPPT
ncbi:MAG: hypothetical protein M5R36_03655 [Deltaproteobacteria bacterium]|nr:hypothetical protein [Deltaproteobacteria bacterium]